MKRKSFKAFVVAVMVGGTVMQFGCLGGIGNLLGKAVVQGVGLELGASISNAYLGDFILPPEEGA